MWPRTAPRAPWTTAGGANYLVTYDTEVYNGGSFDEDAMFATAYPMVELANAVATRMKALRTAVILDTCYSGGSMKSEPSAANGALANKAPSSQMLERMSQGTGRIVMSASQVNEESLESPALRHGYFTYFLLQALKNGKAPTPLSQVYADGGAAGFRARLRGWVAPASCNEQEFGGCGLCPGSCRGGAGEDRAVKRRIGRPMDARPDDSLLGAMAI